MKPSPVILADDLTGSCDVGAEIMRAGRRVRVLMASVSGWESELGRDSGEIPVIDLESRRLSPAEAAKRAASAGSLLKGRGREIIYCKMDSTLRGNWAEEGEALRGVLKAPMVWLAPANPGQGRATLGGRQFVYGRPVECTEYAKDPLQPVECGNVPEILKSAYGRESCAWLSLSEIEKGPSSVRDLLLRRKEEGVRWVVPDARTDRDLRRIAEVVPSRHLVFGAASLARYVVRVRRGKGSSRRTNDRRADLSGRWLAVIGSLNPLTQRQVSLAGGRPGVKVARLGPADIYSARFSREGLGSARWVILALDRAETLRFLKRTGAGRWAGEKFAAKFARYAAVSARKGAFDGWLFSGGLTAACMCEELGIKSLNLQKEVMPGLVISSADAKGRKIKIITKPGGFGAPDALLRLTARSWR